ncbi:hypothetical protein LPUS_09537 [Lasallia pustulata]|uniref:Uncharacterized protein n=1 Tax=Lasallia pustulata TaxID=136370 RepID=A0A1W5D7T8_9LECA|nr:hypothetical protein LPUS_09537 [Lasallia pustulata]
MATIDLLYDGLTGVDFDPRTSQLQYPSRVSWPMPTEEDMVRSRALKRSTTPIQTTGHGFQSATNSHSPPFMSDWQISQSSQMAYSLDTQTFPPQYMETYSIPFQTSPTEFISGPQLDTGLQMDGSYMPMSNQVDGISFNWHDFTEGMMSFPPASGLADMSLLAQNQNSPTDTYLEVRSLSSSDNGWNSIDQPRTSLESYQDPQIGAIFNPSQTLHNRTCSESSYSDVELQSRHSWSSFVEVPNALSSPETDCHGDVDFQHIHNHQYEDDFEQLSSPMAITSSVVQPIAIKHSSSAQTSPISQVSNSPPGRRQPKKSPTTKTAKPMIRRASQTVNKDSEKRVGRRKGPLRPDQRKQAGEIRKLGACLRCKFLKKTVNLVQGVSHLMRAFGKADYERHFSLGLSVGNIKGFSDVERTLFITHGYGHVLPVRAREIFVRDETCFGMDWIETISDLPQQYGVNTAKLSAGMEGISTALLSDYLDRHIDPGFEDFIDNYFEGTPFITQILKTAYRFWVREKVPVIRKALKLVLAYNLTQHITMVEGIPDEEGFLGKITDENSKFKGKTVAPVMINFQVKCAMADMWRELQKDILEELSSLYSSVYSSKDKLKHWPTIFVLACILLAIWEQMQFDCHYRVHDAEYVNKFCHEMETTPVGVIVGLFSAISQKVPSFHEWDSTKHHTILNSNPAVCDAMDEVRGHVTRYDGYLRNRSRCSFDRDDFDSLSNKFVSKLVIRAN